MIKTCVICGKEFIRPRIGRGGHNAKTCSTSCSLALKEDHHSKRAEADKALSIRKIFDCLICGKDLSHRGKLANTCSKECRSKHKYECIKASEMKNGPRKRKPREYDPIARSKYYFANRERIAAALADQSRLEELKAEIAKMVKEHSNGSA